jgi:hypothetical protein
MADPITLMAAISAGTALAAGGIGAAGTIAQGNAALEAAKAERKQLNRMASEEMAVASRDASEKAREARLLQSRGQAVAASSGGMATDATVLELAGNIAKDANVQTRDLLRTGQVKADDLLYRGNVGVETARTNRKLSRLAAGGQIISAVGQASGAAAPAFEKYGQGAPSSGTSAKSWWG